MLHRKSAKSGGADRGRDPYDLMTGPSEWSDQPKEKRDPKKLILIAGLAILSWVATYVGMLELIEANIGDLPLTHKVIIGFSVGMLMTMVVWLLDQLFQPIGFFTKLSYAFGYIFLSLISIGFGFGFYWKVLESKGEGTRGAESAISQVQAPLQTAAARMETLQKTLDTLKTTSQQKAEIERTQGTSCPNSRPGDGPRRKLRDDDAARFSFASDFVKGRIDGVKGDIISLEADLVRITKDDRSIVDARNGTRNEFMRTMNRRLDTTVTGFNAFRGDPQLKQIRNDLAERADKSQFIDTQGKPYACPDQGLAIMIKSVVASIDALPVMEKPKIATVEGSDATIEAFRRLTATFYGALAFKVPPSADELRELQKKAVATAEGGGKLPVVSLEGAGLSKRDYIPLAIAIFVDLCLLLVSMGRPSDRLGGMVSKMRKAEQGPVIQVLSRFHEIHHDRQIRENFEIFRHVVFDLNGDYYVAVPLDAPPRMNPRDREDLRLEAQLLSNLFTSFEKEKIFARVLMPYITTKQIQRKLWKQGSKFAHAESFRLYKFKDGAWSEIILGAIMGAAKRVEAQKRARRNEEDLFTRTEPGFGAAPLEGFSPAPFTGPASQAAAQAAHGQPTGYPPSQQQAARAAGRSNGIELPMGEAMPQRAAVNQVPGWNAPGIATGYAAAAAQRPQSQPQMGQPYPGHETSRGQAFAQPGPQPSPTLAKHPRAGQAGYQQTGYQQTGYQQAGARRAEAPTAGHHGNDDTAAGVADLRGHKRRLEDAAEIAIVVPPANSNTAPASGAAASQAASDRPRIEAEPAVRIEAEPAVRIEAVERTVTWHLPAGEAVPPSLRHLMQGTMQATGRSADALASPRAIEATPKLIEATSLAVGEAAQDRAGRREADAWQTTQPIVSAELDRSRGGDDHTPPAAWNDVDQFNGSGADLRIDKIASRFAKGSPQS